MSKRPETALDLSFLSHFLLEDEIYMRIDKLQALCNAQVMLDASDTAPAPQIRVFYSLVIEEQVQEIRKLMDKLFV